MEQWSYMGWSDQILGLSLTLLSVVRLCRGSVVLLWGMLKRWWEIGFGWSVGGTDLNVNLVTWHLDIAGDHILALHYIRVLKTLKWSSFWSWAFGGWVCKCFACRFANNVHLSRLCTTWLCVGLVKFYSHEGFFIHILTKKIPFTCMSLSVEV